MADESYVIIGNSTTVSFSNGGCVSSVQWGFSPNVQRMWCLDGQGVNSSNVLEFYKPTETASVTVYSPGTSFNVEPSDSCVNASTVSLSVSPSTCGGSSGGVSGDWYVNSYSYSKEEKALPGQETWSLQRWVTGGISGATVPTYVLRGISEGQGTSNSGVRFTGTTVDATTGSVQAGGFGKGSTVTMGRITSVGGGSGSVGDIGNGSASVPHTPLFNV